MRSLKKPPAGKRGQATPLGPEGRIMRSTANGRNRECHVDGEHDAQPGPGPGLTDNSRRPGRSQPKRRSRTQRRSNLGEAGS